MNMSAVQKELDHLRNIHILHFIFVAVLCGLVGLAWTSEAEALQGEVEALEGLLKSLGASKPELSSLRRLFQNDLKTLERQMSIKLGLALDLNIQLLDGTQTPKLMQSMVRELHVISATPLGDVYHHKLDEVVDWLSKVKLQMAVFDGPERVPEANDAKKCQYDHEYVLNDFAAAADWASAANGYVRASATFLLAPSAKREAASDDCPLSESISPEFKFKPVIREIHPNRQFFRQLFPRLEKSSAETHDKTLTQLRDWSQQTTSRVSQSIQGFNIFGLNVRDHVVSLAIAAILLLALYMNLCLDALRLHLNNQDKNKLMLSEVLPTWIIAGPGLFIGLFGSLVLWLLPVSMVYISVILILNQSHWIAGLLSIPTGLLGLRCHRLGGTLYEVSNGSPWQRLQSALQLLKPRWSKK